MKQRYTLLLIFLTCLSLGNMAQQVSFMKYTVYDGLVANPVRCIYQDKKGFIWVGTYDGLSRYDGYKFNNYTSINGLSHSVVNDIFEADGKIMIAENDGSVDVIQNNSILQKTYKAPTPINVFGLHNDRLLASADANGFYEYKNDSIFSIPQQKINSSLSHFISLNDSLILSAGDDDDLFLYEQDLRIQSSLEYAGTYISYIMQDSKNRIWICTSGGLKLIQIKHDKQQQIVDVPLPAAFNIPALTDAQVTSMIEEQDGSFWIGTLKGLVRLLPDGNYQVYDEKDGLPSARVNCLYPDMEKNLWIGTSLGLAKWVSRNNVAFFNTETQDFSNDIITIPSANAQKIILKIDFGLQTFNFYKKEFKEIKAPVNHWAVPVSGSSPLLVYYPDRVGMLDVERNVVTSINKLDTTLNGVISALIHPEGDIFLATFGGMYVAHKQSVKKILPYRITSIVIDKTGCIWVGTWANGLYRITIKNIEQGLYDVLDIGSRIKEKQIRGLYVDRKNNTWVGTRHHGAFCFTPTAKDSFDVKNFNLQSGLMSNWVISFAETKTDDIWVGTYLGLDRMVKQDSGYRIFNFSKAVNFFAEIKKIVPFDDHWICVANRGIAIFKDEDLHTAAPLKPVIFSSSLGVLEDKITIFSPVDKITLKPSQNAAKFEFGSLGFINERNIMYSYRLKGISDTSWSKPANIHEASYETLSPGNYTFEVKTLGWNGEYSIPTSFSFRISTPFWKQWWFIALCVLTIAGFFYALYRYRINQLLRLQTVRNSIATDLHDDIGSSLTNISILSELSSKNIYEPDKAQSFLHRISEEVQTSSQAMDDIIWSVNSRNDSLQETMARMRRYAAELFDNSDIDCHLQLDEKAGDKKLSMEQRRDLYLIYKEALNNIHKHAHAGNVWVHVAQNHNHLSMHIKDDGKGFDTSSITHRNGLKNLRSRVDKWNGKIQIASEIDKGSSIDIKIPLKE